MRGMHGSTDIFAKDEAISLNTVGDMVKFALGGLEQEEKDEIVNPKEYKCKLTGLIK